jgi:hypothetical protein
MLPMRLFSKVPVSRPSIQGTEHSYQYRTTNF